MIMEAAVLLVVPVAPNNNHNNNRCHSPLLLLPENCAVQNGIFGQRRRKDEMVWLRLERLRGETGTRNACYWHSTTTMEFEWLQIGTG